MQSTSQIKWTWADLISSYTFWGLLFFLCLSVSIQIGLIPFSMPYLLLDYDYTRAEMGVLISSRLFGTLIGIIPAWFISRAKSHYPLYIISGIAILSSVLTYINLGNLTILYVSLLVYGICCGTITLLIPAFIARAVNSIEFFVLSYGLVATFNLFLNFFSGPLISYFSTLVTVQQLFLYVIIINVIALLCLIPMKKSFFTDAPPIRHIQSTTNAKQQDPFITFILFFVPFYYIYWFAKVHNQMRNFTQSQKLLSPVGAGFSALLVPLGIPIMLSCLSDVISETNNSQRPKTWGVIVWAIIFTPISAALVQSKLNQLYQENRLSK